jgi:iron complex outermembrane receptor protein
VARTPNGLITRVNGLLQNIGEIRTRGIDVTVNYRTQQTSAGMFGLSLNGNFLLAYSETVPAQSGFTTTVYRGTTRGFPDQSYPRFKGTGVVDWTIGDLMASFTGRYIDSVREADGKKLNSRFYSDVQIGYTPGFLDRRMMFTIGVNNVFNTNPPPCFSCTGPNFDPTTYDVPGQFGYLRISYKM